MILPTIAIDGPSASGKGTLARGLAETLDFAFLDTGGLYRLTGLQVLRRGGDPDKEADALAAANEICALFAPEMLSDPDLRREDVSAASSKSAVHPPVRAALTGLMRRFAASPPQGKKGAVLDGRDIGTIVCPQAEVKLFVTASVEVRAARRFKELQSKGIEGTYEAVLTDLRQRDERDSTRKADPLRPAEDAVILDTSEMSAEAVLEKALGLIRKQLAA